MSASDTPTKCPHGNWNAADCCECKLTAANRKLERAAIELAGYKGQAENCIREREAKLATFESVEVPEELAQIVFLRQLNNPTQRDKELLAYIDTLLLAYRAQGRQARSRMPEEPEAIMDIRRTLSAKESSPVLDYLNDIRTAYRAQAVRLSDVGKQLVIETDKRMQVEIRLSEVERDIIVGCEKYLHETCQGSICGLKRQQQDVAIAALAQGRQGEPK